MYGRLTGADALPWHLGLRTAVTDARAYDLIDVAALRISPGATLVRVCGEVDLLTAPILRSELHHQLDWPPSVLVVDLTQVRFLGVSGIEVLIEVRERALRTATLLRLVHNTRAVARPLQILHLGRLFPSYLKLAEALTVDRS
jgi:anti-sigma B factor antagonist